MLSIFEGVLDAFKLNRFQPNFKHSSLKACAGHPKRHQGQQPQSGTSKSSSTPAGTLEMQACDMSVYMRTARARTEFVRSLSAQARLSVLV